MCVCEREGQREREPDSELVGMKVKEEDREQDGDQTANEGQIVQQWDVYTETGRGSEYLRDRHFGLSCMFHISIV